MDCQGTDRKNLQSNPIYALNHLLEFVPPVLPQNCIKCNDLGDRRRLMWNYLPKSGCISTTPVRWTWRGNEKLINRIVKK